MYSILAFVVDISKMQTMHWSTKLETIRLMQYSSYVNQRHLRVNACYNLQSYQILRIAMSDSVV